MIKDHIHNFTFIYKFKVIHIYLITYKAFIIIGHFVHTHITLLLLEIYIIIFKNYLNKIKQKISISWCRYVCTYTTKRTLASPQTRRHGTSFSWVLLGTPFSRSSARLVMQLWALRSRTQALTPRSRDRPRGIVVLKTDPRLP